MSDLYRRFGLTVVPPNPADAGKSFSDAELECEHGRLLGDRTPPCGFWAGEGRSASRAASSRRRTRRVGRND